MGMHTWISCNTKTFPHADFATGSSRYNDNWPFLFGKFFEILLCDQALSVGCSQVFPRQLQLEFANAHTCVEDIPCGNVFSCLVSLGFHDPFHVARPSVLTGNQSAGRLGQPLRQNSLLNLKHDTGTNLFKFICHF